MPSGSRNENFGTGFRGLPDTTASNGETHRSSKGRLHLFPERFARERVIGRQDVAIWDSHGRGTEPRPGAVAWRDRVIGRGLSKEQPDTTIA